MNARSTEDHQCWFDEYTWPSPCSCWSRARLLPWRNRSSIGTRDGGAVGGLHSPERATAAPRRDPSTAAIRRGTRDVLASGPLDVGRRELELVARPVRSRGRHLRPSGSRVIGYSSRPAVTSGWRGVGGADKGSSEMPRIHYACLVMPALIVLAGCGHDEPQPRTTQDHRSTAAAASANGGGCPEPAAAATQRDGAAATARRRTGRLAARSLDVERQQLGVAARTICAATAWRDDMGAGPLGTAAGGGGWVWLEGHWA